MDFTVLSAEARRNGTPPPSPMAATNDDRGSERSLENDIWNRSAFAVELEMTSSCGSWVCAGAEVPAPAQGGAVGAGAVVRHSAFLDLATALPLHFLGVSLPCHCISLAFHCLATAFPWRFTALPLPFLGVSLPCHCLFTAFRWECSGWPGWRWPARCSRSGGGGCLTVTPTHRPALPSDAC